MRLHRLLLAATALAAAAVSTLAAAQTGDIRIAHIYS
jgi:hypothetical protein